MEGDIATMLRGEAGSPRLFEVSIDGWGGDGDAFRLNTGGLAAPTILGDVGTDGTEIDKERERESGKKISMQITNKQTKKLFEFNSTLQFQIYVLVKIKWKVIT